MKTTRLSNLLSLIEASPNDPFFPYAIALEYYREGANEECLRYLKQVFDRFPNYLPSYYQYGKVLLETNQPKLAQTILEQGIALAQQQNDTKTQSELQQLLEYLQ